VSHQDVLNIYETKVSKLQNQLSVATEAGIGGTATVSDFLPVTFVCVNVKL